MTGTALANKGAVIITLELPLIERLITFYHYKIPLSKGLGFVAQKKDFRKERTNSQHTRTLWNNQTPVPLEWERILFDYAND